MPNEIYDDDNPCRRDNSLHDRETVFEKNIKRYPPVSPADKLELAKKAARRDKGAKEKLLRSFVPLTRWLARAMGKRDPELDLDDLVQAGLLGASEGIDKFDSTKGSSVEAYVSVWIKSAISDEIDDQRFHTRLSDYMRKLQSKIDTSVEDFQRRHGRDPSEKEIADAARLTEKQVRHARQSKERVSSETSLDASLPGTEDGLTVEEKMPSDESHLPESTAERVGPLQSMSKVLEVLTPKQREVLELRYGLVGGLEMTCQRAAEQLGISPQAVNKHEHQAFKKLRMNEECLQIARDFLGKVPETKSIFPTRKLSGKRLVLAARAACRTGPTPSGNCAIEGNLYQGVLRQLKEHSGYCKKEHVLPIIAHQLKSAAGIQLHRTSAAQFMQASPEAVVQHMLAEGLVREAFKGDEVVLTAKGAAWLQNHQIEALVKRTILAKKRSGNRAKKRANRRGKNRGAH